MAIAPAVAGLVVGHITEKPPLMGISFLWMAGVVLVSLPKVMRKHMRKIPDQSDRAASEFLKQAVAMHPGKPISKEVEE